MNLKKVSVLIAMVCALATLICGCGEVNKHLTSNDELAKEVKTDIEKKFKADKKTAKIKIRNLSVVNTEGNNYKGELEATTPSGKDVKVPVKIIYDGETISWEIAGKDMDTLMSSGSDSDEDLEIIDDFEVEDEE